MVLETESLYGQMELNTKVEAGDARTSVDPFGALWCIKTQGCAVSSQGEEITVSFRLLAKGLPWGRAIHDSLGWPGSYHNTVFEAVFFLQLRWVFPVATESRVR